MPYISLQDQGYGLPAETLQKAAEFAQRLSAARQAQEEQAQQFPLEQKKRGAEAQMSQANADAIARDIALRQANADALRRQEVAQAVTSEGLTQPKIRQGQQEADLATTNAQLAANVAPSKETEASATARAALAKALAEERALMPHNVATTVRIPNDAQPGMTIVNNAGSYQDPTTGQWVSTGSQDEVKDFRALSPVQQTPKDWELKTDPITGKPLMMFNTATRELRRLDATAPQGASPAQSSSGLIAAPNAQPNAQLNPTATQGGAPAAASQVPVPPPEHIAILRNNPQYAAVFDLHYGKGAAQSYLNSATSSTAP